MWKKKKAMAAVLHPHACLDLASGWPSGSGFRKFRTITEQAMPAERSASTRSAGLRLLLGTMNATRGAPTHRPGPGRSSSCSCASEPARFPENSEGEHDAEKACVAECPRAVRTAAACAETTRGVCVQRDSVRTGHITKLLVE
jgi:hypothetical protein